MISHVVRVCVCASAPLSVSPIFSLYFLNDWTYFNETNRSYSVLDLPNTGEGQWVKRQRQPTRHGHRNLANAMSPKPLKVGPDKPFLGHIPTTGYSALFRHALFRQVQTSTVQYSHHVDLMSQSQKQDRDPNPNPNPNPCRNSACRNSACRNNACPPPTT